MLFRSVQGIADVVGGLEILCAGEAMGKQGIGIGNRIDGHIQKGGKLYSGRVFEGQPFCLHGHLNRSRDGYRLRGNRLI